MIISVHIQYLSLSSLLKKMAQSENLGDCVKILIFA